MTQQPEYRAKYNTLSLVGLIISPLVPLVGIALAVAGLQEIGRTHERGRALAIGGIIAGSLILIGQGLILLLYLTVPIWGWYAAVS